MLKLKSISPAARYGLLIDNNLLRQGIDGGSERSLYAFMQDAASERRRFLACSMARRAYVGEG